MSPISIIFRIAVCCSFGASVNNFDFTKSLSNPFATFVVSTPIVIVGISCAVGVVTVGVVTVVVRIGSPFSLSLFLFSFLS